MLTDGERNVLQAERKALEMRKEQKPELLPPLVKAFWKHQEQDMPPWRLEFPGSPAARGDGPSRRILALSDCHKSRRSGREGAYAPSGRSGTLLLLATLWRNHSPRVSALVAFTSVFMASDIFVCSLRKLCCCLDFVF